MKVTIGICAYNEERNIGKLLKSFKEQKLNKDFKIEKIEVVASGCKDKTIDIVKKFKGVKLLVEKERKGKSSATNLLIRNSHSDIIVFQSADTLHLNKHVLNKLLLPFKDKKIGAVGGRSIPKINWKTPIGYINHLIWNLHHRINRFGKIKIGEFCAFRRKLIHQMPYNIVTDEAYLQWLIESKGYKLYYEPDAKIHNKVPLNLFDLLNQRRRVYFGHIQLRKTFGYTVPTMKLRYILFSLIFRRTGKLSIKKIIYTIFAMFLEGFARFVATIDWIRGETPYKWKKYV